MSHARELTIPCNTLTFSIKMLGKEPLVAAASCRGAGPTACFGRAAGFGNHQPHFPISLRGILHGQDRPRGQKGCQPTCCLYLFIVSLCYLMLLLLYCERMCAGPLPWGLPLPSLAAKQKTRKALLLRLSQVFAMAVVTVLVNMSQPLSHAALFLYFVYFMSAVHILFFHAFDSLLSVPDLYDSKT